MDFISPHIMDYCQRMTSPQPTFLSELIEETKSISTSWNMLSGEYQGRLLSLLSQLKRPKIALEIGTYTGFSALCIAEGLAQNGILYTLDLDQRYESLYDHYFPMVPEKTRIEFIAGDANQTLEQIPEQIDFLFIDAAKKQYSHYLDLCKPKLAPGALILADNVLWKGMVAEESSDDRVIALQEFNSKVQKDKDFQNLLLPIRDGIMMAIYKPS